MPILTFNEEKHEYRVDDRVVPSVTQILKQYVEIEIFEAKWYVNTTTGQRFLGEMFDRAADRGRAIHKACKFLLEGSGLDWDALDPALVNPLRQFEAWRQMVRPEPILLEHKMYSPKMDVAGTMDFYGLIEKRPVLIDFKSGVESITEGPQLAAYLSLAEENKLVPPRYRGRCKRYVLRLPEEGAFKFTPMAGKWDLGYFHNCLDRYKFLKGAK